MTAEDRPRGLGRGLSALIGEEAVPTRGESAAARTAHKLPIAFLRPNKLQPRKRFAPEDLNELAESVREKGVLQPILVRPIKGEANAYEIVAKLLSTPTPTRRIRPSAAHGSACPSPER